MLLSTGTLREHTPKLYKHLNQPMRTILFCLKSAPLSVRNSIATLHLRKEQATFWQYKGRLYLCDIPMKQIMEHAPTTAKLKSRRPFHTTSMREFDIWEAWKEESKKQNSSNLVDDPSNPHPDLPS